MTAFRKGPAAPKAAPVAKASQEADPITWGKSKTGQVYGTYNGVVRNPETGRYTQADPLFIDPKVQAAFLASLDKVSLSGFAKEMIPQATAFLQGNAGIVSEVQAIGFGKENIRAHFGFKGPQIAIVEAKPVVTRRKL